MMLLLQIPPDGRSSAEVRAAGQAALMGDIARMHCRFDDLQAHQNDLAQGAAMPVGSVEFVRRAMQLAGIDEPAERSYPQALTDYLHRHVCIRTAGSVIGTVFVKPAARLKAFSGFVFDTMKAPEDYAEHDRQSYEDFMALPAEEPVWVGDPVRFLSEWRMYFEGPRLIGMARYDDGPDEAPQPDVGVALAAAQRWCTQADAGASFALDMGVIEGGETALVEHTDAWAVGLYQGAMTPKQYVDFLALRWRQLHEQSRQSQQQEGASAPAVMLTPRS